MKAVAIICNFFFPGVGSFFVAKVGQGIAQVLLYILGWILTLTAVGAIIGIPLIVGVWIWGLVTAATANPQPIQVTVVHQGAQDATKPPIG